MFFSFLFFSFNNTPKCQGSAEQFKVCDTDVTVDFYGLTPLASVYDVLGVCHPYSPSLLGATSCRLKAPLMVF